MNYQRLDNGCTAKVLAITPAGVLLSATWPANSTDARRFRVQHGVAQNTVRVSKEYFEKKYGVAL